MPKHRRRFRLWKFINRIFSKEIIARETRGNTRKTKVYLKPDKNL